MSSKTARWSRIYAPLGCGASLLALAASWISCRAFAPWSAPKPDFDLVWIVPKLRNAGYHVSDPFPDEVALRLKEVASASCVYAGRAPLGDDLICVVDCPNAACKARLRKRSILGESYGQMHRGDTVLMHRKCASDADSRTGWSCGPIREVIFDRSP